MNYAIIAAGEGSRLRQEGVELPKPLVMLDGKPMIGRLIDIFMSCNPESLTIIVNEQMTEVADYLRSLRLPVPLRLTVKSTPSSMHSFYEVSRALPPEASHGKFCLTTVDTIFRRDDFIRYIEAFEADNSCDGYMAVTPFIDDEKPLYVATSSDLDITGFLDAPAPGVKYVSGGIYGLTAPAIDILEQCMASGASRMRNYQRALVAAGLRLKAFPIPKIVDVDHASDIPGAELFIRS
ncbi:MAG: NTP transferase domain-containing protein [Pseudoflavonifractor sp.]|nr:NTP transferase domain-containing protein [Alloprevotella sp.]MCM1116222.1 NTP transferase domain-containing protein [Pseudoflavonifractor sp.]